MGLNAPTHNRNSFREFSTADRKLHPHPWQWFVVKHAMTSRSIMTRNGMKQSVGRICNKATISIFSLSLSAFFLSFYATILEIIDSLDIVTMGVPG